VSLSTTAINDRHASHRNGFRSTAQNSSETISGLQIRLTHGLSRLERDVGGLSQAPSKTQVKSANSRKRCRWSGTVCHNNRSTGLMEASHDDWRCAEAGDEQLQHQTDCQASDIVHWVVLVTLFCCSFGANVFQRAKSLDGHAKISIISPYLKITKFCLAL